MPPSSIPLDASTRMDPIQSMDAEELHAVVAANREHIGRWMPWARTATPESDHESVERLAARWASGEGADFTLRHAGRIVGSLGIHTVRREERCAELGYWMARDAQGKGLMTRALRALIDHGFREMDLHRLELRTAVANQRSCALAERVGFTREGTLRDASWNGESYEDDAMFGLLEHEWPVTP